METERSGAGEDANSLRSAFSLSHGDHADISKVHLSARLAERDLLLAKDGGSVAGVQERDVRLLKSARDLRLSRERARSKAADSVLMLALLEEQSHALARHIQTLETRFEERLGDAWREEIANAVLDPDEIPQREAGESMAEYRQRLEEVLVARMIDPVTGEIRPEFANDPDLAEWAAWAKSKFDQARSDNVLAKARAVADDPTLSEEAKANQIREAMSEANIESVLLTDREQDIATAYGSAAVDGDLDAKANAQAAAATFSGF